MEGEEEAQEAGGADGAAGAKGGKAEGEEAEGAKAEGAKAEGTKADGAKAEEGAKAADERKKPSSGGAAKKVTIRKSVAQRISLFNVSGELKKELRLSVVALALSKLEEQEALDVLDALLEASDDVEDPDAFVCKRAREVAKDKAAEEAARAAAEEEEWQEEGGEAEEGGEEAPKKKKKKKAKAEDAEDDGEEDTPEAAVRRRVKTLNEGETLWEPIRFKRLETLMPMVGAEEVLKILERLETKAEDLANPTAWLRKEVMKKLGPVLSRCDQLNRSVPGKMDLLAAIDLAEVREPLSVISESTAFRILKELENRVFEIKDPTSWIIEEAKKKAPSGPLVEQIKKLNACGRLQQQLDLGRAMDVLAAVDEKKGLWILSYFGTRAEKIRNPIGWLAAEVRARQAAPKPVGPVAALAGLAGKGLGKGPGPAAPKRPPPAHLLAAAAASAVKRPRTAEAAAPAKAKAPAKAPAKALAKAPAKAAAEALAEAAADGEEQWEEGQGDDAGAAEEAEAEEVEEACQLDDIDGDDPDAIG